MSEIYTEEVMQIIKRFRNAYEEMRDAFDELASKVGQREAEDFKARQERQPMSSNAERAKKRLGAYLNTVVADLHIEGKGEYFRDLFAKYEAELSVMFNAVQLDEAEWWNSKDHNRYEQVKHLAQLRAESSSNQAKETI